ncbi:MAG: hypothetical protein HY821_21550 [Acidobacteria bacterium]|nr:hypothetical protein [Acidobacteriota bacterium]
MEDPQWQDTAARLARQAGARVVPVYFGGANSALFQIAGLLHPRLRTALLPHELLNKKNSRMEVRVGQPLPAERVETDEMRRRTFWMARRGVEPRKLKKLQARLGPDVPVEWVEKELEELPAERVLARSGVLEVRLAAAWRPPKAEDLRGFPRPQSVEDLDGLIVVDLMTAPRKQVERYLGPEGAASFYGRHGGE